MLCMTLSHIIRLRVQKRKSERVLENISQTIKICENQWLKRSAKIERKTHDNLKNYTYITKVRSQWIKKPL